MAKCLAIGGRIWTPNSAEEVSFVRNGIGPKFSVWVDATSQTQWRDGTQIEGLVWEEGRSFKANSCVTINSASKLYDVSCTEERRAVCEIDHVAPTEPPHYENQADLYRALTAHTKEITDSIIARVKHIETVLVDLQNGQKAIWEKLKYVQYG